MSWYLFQSAPAVKLRGIKVTDYERTPKLKKKCIDPKLASLGE